MKRKILSIFLLFTLLITLFPTLLLANENEEIIILYENDVHGAVESYSKVKAYKDELLETQKYVSLVSAGDFIQGTGLIASLKGEYPIHLMNLVGYDALTLGNHEFDYEIKRLDELVKLMDTKPISANFLKIDENEPYFEPYKIMSYGDVDVAFIGITTPSTISSTSPSQFKNEEGEYIYSFSATNLFEVVQSYIDEVEKIGVDYIIALSHLGDCEKVNTSVELIENTRGLDVVIDGHSHSVIEGEYLKDASGNEVLLTSTGSKFEYLGQLTLDGDEIKTELIPLETYEKRDPAIDAYLQLINDEYALYADRVIGYSEYDLITHDEEGNRLVRLEETNLGDFASDAYRIMTNANCSYFNGGGLREAISKGEITYGDLLNTLPFGNEVAVIKVTGQQILDLLELRVYEYPEEGGGFPHVSGLKFSLNGNIASSVVIDEYENFVKVDGPYRITDLEILNQETKEYEAIDLEKEYTLAGQNYHMIELGGGLTMLEGAEVVLLDGRLDVEIFEEYIDEVLGGTIGDEYKEVSPNITFIEEIPTQNNLSMAIIVSISILIVLRLTIWMFNYYRKKD